MEKEKETQMRSIYKISLTTAFTPSVIVSYEVLNGHQKVRKLAESVKRIFFSCPLDRYSKAVPVFTLRLRAILSVPL